MKEADLHELVNRYLNNRATADEIDFLLNHFQTEGEDQILRLMMQGFNLDQPATAEEAAEDPALDIAYHRIRQKIHNKQQKIRWYKRIAAAAAIIVGLSVPVYWLMQEKKSSNDELLTRSEQRLPVQQGVVLTTSTGKRINLGAHDQRQVQVAKDYQARIADSALFYNEGESNAAAAEMNTLTNNSGRRFDLHLSDGTAVTLDAHSSITYPVAFSGPLRKVSIDGQVFFKVAHKIGQLFRVEAHGQMVQDIGTEFNIRAFDEPVTTLISGAVRVTFGNHNAEPKPGESVVGSDLIVRVADLEEVTAWMQGRMNFNHAPLVQIAAEIERIYDVKFVWRDERLKQVKFLGSVSRTKKLANVLNALRVSGNVDFSVEGKTVYVFAKKNKASP